MELVEKHICLPGIESEDSKFSMSLKDFERLVQDVHNAKDIYGSIFYGATVGEKENIMFRRSLFAAKDIRQGEVLTKENICIIRPGMGMKPKYYYEILGKFAKRNIKFGEPILPELIYE